MRDFKTFVKNGEYQHYTCQSVPDNELKKRGISKVGEQYGIEAREVLSFPTHLFKKLGLMARTSEEMQINCERILKTLK